MICFSGASPVRRDFGRGFTASQWARFCGRYTCAESIEKFVRTAVPGGASLISDSSGGGSLHRCILIRFCLVFEKLSFLKNAPFRLTEKDLLSITKFLFLAISKDIFFV